MMHRIVHVIDANMDTAYFRALVRHADATRYPVTIGSLAPVGAKLAHRLPVATLELKNPMSATRWPTTSHCRPCRSRSSSPRP